MTETLETVPVSVHGVITARIDDEYLIEGYGFTISHTAGDANLTQPLLAEDIFRTRAVIFANSAAAFIGTPEQMSSISTAPAGTDPGPGCRLPAGAIGTEIYSQAEVWVAFTAVCQIGVWVERKVPRGVR